MLTIDWRDLGIPQDEKPFAEGAVGELYPVRNEVAGLPGRKLVFKRVKKDLPQGLDRKHVLGQMRSVVAHRDGMSADELADLDDVAVWPLAMVRQAGTEVGIVLDLIDDSFFVAAKSADGTPSKVLFELQFLCVSDGYFNKKGIDPAVTGDDVMRLALAARLAYAIEVVHRCPVVFGDLHLKNAVAAARPFARVLLMDCDSVAELSDTSRIQLHGPGFIPPEIREQHQRTQDQETDVYKLGLCIVRALSPGKGATQATDPAKTTPGILDAEGIKLLQRAVGVDRSRRPKASDLREYLVRRVRGKIQIPELLSAELSHRVVLRGSDVFVRWEHKHGTEVRIFGTNGFSLEGIDADKCAAGLAIRPTTAGPIDVEVWNPHGPSNRIRAGLLDFYELPELDIAGQLRGIPRPVMSEIPVLNAKALAAIRPYPMATLPDVNIEVSGPQVEYPPVSVGFGDSALEKPIGHGIAASLDNLENKLGKAMRRAAKRMRDDTVSDPPGVT